MEPVSAFLLSMQAAGLVTSLVGNRSQRKLIRLGRELENEQFKTNLEAIKVQSAEASLDEMKLLRKNLGSQIANNAARGNRGGSSFWTMQESVTNFQTDERRRRLNLLAQEAQLRAGHVLSGLHTLQSETQLGQSLMRDFVNTLPVSSAVDKIFNPSTKGTGSTAFKGNEDQFNWGY